MIHLNDNTCYDCKRPGLKWNINYTVTDMEMFKCGHGLCKDCFGKIRNNFRCPICNEDGQLHTTENPENIGTWNSFAEWYDEYKIYIETGYADNIIQHTVFGKQLLRLMKENKKLKKNKSDKCKSHIAVPRNNNIK